MIRSNNNKKKNIIMMKEQQLGSSKTKRWNKSWNTHYGNTTSHRYLIVVTIWLIFVLVSLLSSCCYGQQQDVGVGVGAQQQVVDGHCEGQIDFINGTHKPIYELGVLAIRGFDAAYAEFNTTFSDYLTQTAGQRFNPPVEFRLKPLNFLLLFSDTASAAVDFFYVNPSAYSCIESEFGASTLVSQISKRVVDDQVYELTQFGGVIFTLANSTIESVEDLKNHSIAAASISGLGSGQMQFRVLQQKGLSYINDPSQLVFTSNQGKVVQGVLNGEFEVGFVRTDQLESTTDANGNPIDRTQIKIIDPIDGLEIDGIPFPFASSTPLYAEWNVAALPHVPNEVNLALQDSLLGLQAHAKFGDLLVGCYEERNCSFVGINNTNFVSQEVCEQSCNNELLSSNEVVRCDTTMDLALLAREARTNGKYTGWRSTLSYMELRNMQEETGFIVKNEINGTMQCIRSANIYDAIVCPPGHFKKSQEEVDSGCADAGLPCLDGYQCVCKPCVKAFDVDIFQVLDVSYSSLPSLDEEDELSGGTSSSSTGRSTVINKEFKSLVQNQVGCEKFSICGSTEQTKPIVFVAVDNKKRDDLNLVVRLHREGSYQDRQAKAIAGMNYTYAFEVTSQQVGVLVFEIFANDEQVPESPLRVNVGVRNCASDYNDGLRVADENGNCVCSSNSIKMGGRCVSYAILIPAVLIPFILMGAGALFVYVEKKKKQADSVWAVKVSELIFDDPPTIVGRGTFGLVLLAEYRGTQVAVKRVIPPKFELTQKKKKGSGGAGAGAGGAAGPGGTGGGGGGAGTGMESCVQRAQMLGDGDYYSDDDEEELYCGDVSMIIGQGGRGMASGYSSGAGSSWKQKLVSSSSKSKHKLMTTAGEEAAPSLVDATAATRGTTEQGAAAAAAADTTAASTGTTPPPPPQAAFHHAAAPVTLTSSNDVQEPRRHSIGSETSKNRDSSAVPISALPRRISFNLHATTSAAADDQQPQGGSGGGGQRRSSLFNTSSVGGGGSSVGGRRRSALDIAFDFDQDTDERRRSSRIDLLADDDSSKDDEDADNADNERMERTATISEHVIDVETGEPIQTDNNDAGLNSTAGGGGLRSGWGSAGMLSRQSSDFSMNSIGNDDGDNAKYKRSGGGNSGGTVFSYITKPMKGFGKHVRRAVPFGQMDEYKKLKADFISEMRHLSKLRHPCITTVMGAVISNFDEPMLVMEYMDHGSLHDILHNETMVVDGELLLPILRDIAQGVRFLHTAEPQVIHGDLKAQNVLVDGKFRAKVADFGLSQKKKVGATGTPYWMAPELLRGESQNNAASDVFSFGIILYEVYSRKDPYEGEDYREVIRAVADPVVNKRPPVPKSMPPTVVALMAECLASNPAARPTFEEMDQRLKRLDVSTIEPGKLIFSHQRKKDQIVERTSQVFEDLFPRHVAQALREGRKVEPEHFDCVTIFFSDIVGFTDISSKIDASKVSDMLDRLYIKFDDLSEAHDVFKIETIGDAYICVTNLVKTQGDHAARIARFAIDAIRTANETLVDTDQPELGYVNIRVGFHTGPVVANVVGSRHPKYTIFGDTVNTASRMESNSIVNRIQCSDVTAKLVKEQDSKIPLLSRGAIHVKGKGDMITYWVNEEHDKHPKRPSDSDGGTKDSHKRSTNNRDGMVAGSDKDVRRSSMDNSAKDSKHSRTSYNPKERTSGETTATTGTSSGK